ncbi:MAG: hypothetical protein J0H98_08305 [Solirubrobacterales bacterium]|nr:hypothetical protein [Solirubrobacterales bacterium]
MADLAYQCPGCFSVTMNEQNPDGYECACGERLTLIDLRDTRGIGMPLGSYWLTDRGVLLEMALASRGKGEETGQ